MVTSSSRSRALSVFVGPLDPKDEYTTILPTTHPVTASDPNTDVKTSNKKKITVVT